MADPVREFEAYRRDLLDRLGQRDPLEILAATPMELESRVGDLDESTVSRRAAPGVWSVREVVGHLGDTEWVYGYRVRLMLTHDDPELTGYDQDRMAVGLAHNDRHLTQLLEEFRQLRGLNLDLYRRSKGPSWDRVGQHSERGEESVGLNVRLLAGHDLRHLEQIDRILEARSD